MCAFGPFANTEIIEFKRLGDNPLFLINGPTGSGKTTILDAICFALYGSTTGNEREASQMRCDHASAESITKIELVFQIRDSVYRIVREPEQQRPKLRGEGYTIHKARAELYRVGDDGKESLMVAAKVLEATSEIENLTGLNVEQFRQVMVLPQGEFRRLLMADSKERENVFSKLFQTRIYKHIEEELKAQSARLRNELEALRNQQKGILDSADLEDEAALQAELDSQKPLLVDAVNAKAEQAKILNKIREELLSAQQLDQQFERLLTAKKQLEELLSQSKEMEQHKTDLKRARLAIKLKSENDQLKRAAQALNQAQSRQQAAQLAVKTSRDLLQETETELTRAKSKEQDIENARAQKQQLESYVERVAQLEGFTRSLQTCTSAAEQAQQRVKKHQSSLLASEAAVQKTDQELTQLATKLKDLGVQQLQLAALTQLLKHRQQQDKFEHLLSECTHDLHLERQALQRASEELGNYETTARQLEIAWHQGQAALLAKELEEGQACLVCGSEHHPNPATSQMAIPDDEHREVAAKNVELARKKSSAIDNKISVLSARKSQLLTSLEEIKTELGEYALQTLEQVQELFNLQQSVVNTLEAEQLHEKKLAKSLEQLKTSRDTIQLDVFASEKELIVCNTDLEVARKAYETARAEIPEPYRASGALEKKIEEVSLSLSSLQKQLNAAQQNYDAAKLQTEKAINSASHAAQIENEAIEALSAAKTVWQQALENSLFSDEQDYQLAIRADDQISTLQDKIQRFDAEVAEARGAINTLQRALAASQRPQITLIEQRLQQVELEYLELERKHAQLDRRVSKLVDIAEKLTKAKTAAKTIEDDYAVIGTLSDLANGKTGKRISLQRFVLSVLLDDVLVEASQRLKRMSKGRYELYRHLGKGKGAGASGLELMVEDAYNGKQRSVATLSGGESFMAALSLALGLSDVVQAYSGGIRLDTLFVDEGFGSLDPESLDLAVNTLIDLQASGRMVGVISHVPELKERINVRLDVHANRAGSTTSIVSG
jgi:exonuclease SbcC